MEHEHLHQELAALRERVVVLEKVLEEEKKRRRYWFDVAEQYRGIYYKWLAGQGDDHDARYDGWKCEDHRG